VILFQINTQCFAINKFKRDAPWTVDVNGVSGRFKTAQSIKIKSWHIPVCRVFGGVQRTQPQRNARVQLAVNPSAHAL
jgi:hypothetical protein